MANPVPQHTPTDGLGVAAYVQVTGTNVTNNSGGAGTAQGTIGTPLGQGIGAAPSGTRPNAQYALTLSLSAATVNGVTYAATCQLTTVLKDAQNNTYLSGTAITNVALTSNVATLTVANSTGALVAGNSYTITGLVTATFLNGQTVTLLTANATTITFAFTHANYGSAADTGNIGSGNSPTYKSYNNPSKGSPSWFRPSVFVAVPPYNNGDVASVSSTGLVTSLAAGEAVVEVQFPTFDNTEGTSSGTSDPFDMIYCQIVVHVIA